MEIPRAVQLAVSKRGGFKRVANELEARKRIVESNRVVYSTRDCPETKDELQRLYGGSRVSPAVRTSNPFDGAKIRSGRTKFYTFGGKLCCDQSLHVRIMRKT